MFGPTLIGSTFALAGLLAFGQPAHAAARAPGEPPGVRIWTNHGEVYQHAERFQVFFRTERDAYVTVFRVDTDGRVHVLFPLDPGDPNLAHGGETYSVPGVDDHDAFVVDDAPGVGYVFAVASQDPFTYDAFESNDHWSFQTTASLVDGRIHGDPAASLQDLVQNIVPQGYADYDTHLLPYDVEQRYDYPRFLCYDCHAYTPYTYWDPYSVWCPRFSLDVYYNPFYYYPSYWYPTRYYGGTNVVYVRPGIAGRQFVFRNRVGQAAPYVVYRDRRGGMQQPPERGVRGVDLGGVGSIPSPGGRRTVGGPSDQGPSGRRMVGGNGGQLPGAGPAARQPVARAPQETGRRQVREAIPEPVTNPRVIGPSVAQPSHQDIAPVQPRRGVYIDPGTRQSDVPAVAGGRPAPREGQQQRGVYIDPGARQGGAPPAAAGGPAPRESPRYIPQGGAGPESRGGRGYGVPAPTRGAGSGAPREAPGYAPRGGGSGSAPPAARAAPRAAPAPRSSPALVRRRR